MGEIFSAIRKEKFQRIGVVGLGIGTLAAYAEPKDSWTFFELDPAVLHIARDTNYFTYLQNSKAKETNYILGDARIKLAELPDNSFDVLILDAFTSDAIPTHLITLEALNLYWQKLRPDGLLVFNISNRYFSFATLLANLAQATDSQAKLKELNVADDSQEDKAGAASSSWIVMSKNKNLTFPSWETVKSTSQRI
jgi:spermidine synthase